MFAPVWSRVVKGNYASSIEQISGFSRFRVIGEQYPAVLREQAPLSGPTAKPSVLEGRVYWNLSEPDQERLDRFEGSDYQRIQVLTASHKSVGLYLYLWSDRVSAEPWDPAWFEGEGMSLFLERYPGF